MLYEEKRRRSRRKFLKFGYIQKGGYIQMRARVPGREQGVSREPGFQLRTPLATDSAFFQTIRWT